MWGITARNREQNFALNALMDPEIDFVTLLGTAGTGKTLLALAAGLAQTMDQQRYREIIMTRATVSVGEDIGFLPGTEEEKMTPWMGALTDNLEVLTHNQEGGSWGRAATNDLLASRIKIRSMNFMRGRTFLNRWLILDEAQNLTPKQMKTLITRAGPGTKIVCLGNVEQIDTPYLTETTSGLTYAVDRFKNWDAQRAHHAASRRAFAPGGLRVGSAVERGATAKAPPSSAPSGHLASRPALAPARGRSSSREPMARKRELSPTRGEGRAETLSPCGRGTGREAARARGIASGAFRQAHCRHDFHCPPPLRPDHRRLRFRRRRRHPGRPQDLRRASACTGCRAIAALTAQHTRGVTAVHVPPTSTSCARRSTPASTISTSARSSWACWPTPR